MPAPAKTRECTEPELLLCELGPPAHGLESLSPFCLKVHRALHFHGLDYQSRHAIRPSEHRRYNASGQVPVLLIDGNPVPDSTNILGALENRAPTSLLPGDARDRARAWLWEDYADRVLGFYVFAARWFDDRNWPALADEQFRPLPALLKPWLPLLIRRRILKGMANMEFIRAGQQGCWAMFEEHLDKLDARAPGEDFWIGERPTVADIGLFGMLHCLRSPLSQWQHDRIVERQRLNAWLDRVDAITRR